MAKYRSVNKQSLIAIGFLLALTACQQSVISGAISPAQTTTPTPTATATTAAGYAIINVTPTSGTLGGGTPISILMTGVTTSSTVSVSINGAVCTNPTLLVGDPISTVGCTTGAYPKGGLGTVIVTIGSQITTAVNSFYYSSVAPNTTPSFSPVPVLPNTGPMTAPIAGYPSPLITVYGTNFDPTSTGVAGTSSFQFNSAVFFNGYECTPLSVSTTQIVCLLGVFPYTSSVSADVLSTLSVSSLASAQSASVSNAFTYHRPPVLYSSNQGTTQGTTITVTINGTNLDTSGSRNVTNSASWRFNDGETMTNGSTSTNVSCTASGQTLYCSTSVLGTYDTGAIDFVTTNSDGQQVTLARALTVSCPSNKISTTNSLGRTICLSCASGVVNATGQQCTCAPNGSTYSLANNRCVCPASAPVPNPVPTPYTGNGYLNGTALNSCSTCPTNSTFSSPTSTCVCNSGYLPQPQSGPLISCQACPGGSVLATSPAYGCVCPYFSPVASPFPIPAPPTLVTSCAPCPNGSPSTYNATNNTCH